MWRRFLVSLCGLPALLSLLTGAAAAQVSQDQQYQAARQRCQGAVDQIVAALGPQAPLQLFGDTIRDVAGQSNDAINRQIADLRQEAANAPIPAFRLVYEAEICYMQTYLEVRLSAPATPPPSTPAAPARTQQPVSSPATEQAQSDGLNPSIAQSMAEADRSGFDVLRQIREGLDGGSEAAGPPQGEPSPLGLRGATPQTRPPSTTHNRAPTIVRRRYEAPQDCVLIEIDPPEVNSEDNWVTQARLTNNCGVGMNVRLETAEEVEGQGIVSRSVQGYPWTFDRAPIMWPTTIPLPTDTEIGFRPADFVYAPANHLAVRSQNLYLTSARPEAPSRRILYWLVACPAINDAGRATVMFLSRPRLEDAGSSFRCMPMPEAPPTQVDMRGTPVRSVTGPFSPPRSAAPPEGSSEVQEGARERAAPGD